ncbi:MAG: hypothetical protein Aurels2KO_42100 [Aureliella sp.]
MVRYYDGGEVEAHSVGYNLTIAAAIAGSLADSMRRPKHMLSTDSRHASNNCRRITLHAQ